MESLDVDSLIPLMPVAVREEYLAHGDASIFGFSPGVGHWLKTSEHPRVARWRDDLKRVTAQRINAALREQVTMSELARELYARQTGSVRYRAIIHPLIKGWMETQYGGNVWNNRESIADTERLQPKLFVK